MKKEASARAPYSVLARYYDEVYAAWRAHLGPARDEILRSRGVTAASVIDVGCGSGWQSLELARRGNRVLAVDPVPAFLSPLGRKAKREGLGLEVREGSLLSLPLSGDERFDLALATFDVFNHLDSHGELSPALGEVARALVPGGHLLFDVNTPDLLATVSEHHRVWRLRSGAVSAETGVWDERKRKATLHRDWFIPVRGSHGKQFDRVRERYQEIAWGRDVLRSSLTAAGFSIRLFADAGGWLSLLPARAKWIILARLRGPAPLLRVRHPRRVQGTQ